MMDTADSREYPIKDVYHAIRWQQFKNPARAKQVNLLEQIRGSKPAHEQFSGLHPHDIYASVVAAIQSVLRRADGRERLVFELYHYRRLNKHDIAREISRTYRTVDRILHSLHERLEAELIWRELMQPESVKFW